MERPSCSALWRSSSKSVAEIERLRRGIAVGEDRWTTEEVIAA
jgi:hypothetical protein